MSLNALCKSEESVQHRGRFSSPDYSILIRRTLSLIACAFLFCTSSAFAANEPPASVVMTEGTVHVVRAEQGKRVIVSPGSPLARGDVIHTGRDSSVRVRFSDSGELAVRPNSTVAIDDYRFVAEKPEQDSFVLRLLKGGLRQLTGAIGKRGNRDAYQLKSVTATIGIRGTDFTARLCDDDCRLEGRARGLAPASEKPINNNPRPVSARVVAASGSLTAVEVTGVIRKLSPGAPVYAGDLIETDAAGPASIVFQDQTKIVIDRRSAFQVDSFRYTADRPQSDNMGLRLLKGGLRVLSGLIAKRSSQKVGFNTAVATIGIRGTNFDLICAPAGLETPDSPPADRLEGASCNESLYAYTREGAISVKVGDGPELILPSGESGLAAGAGVQPRKLPAVPEAIKQRDWVAPEDIQVNVTQLFGEDGRDTNEPGLFVMVREGSIALSTASGSQMEFAAGESGRLSRDGERLIRFSSTPSFLQQDRVLSDQIIGYGVCRP